MAYNINTEEARLENLEDLYQLSPMQQGMLFHTIYAPESGAYFEQTVFTIKGELDKAAFERAWQRVVKRHSILRSSFLWEDLEKPLQVVYREVSLAIDERDLRHASSEEQQAQLEDYLRTDRARGFDLGAAPLLRLALFRLSDQLYKFTFTRHHLLLDRWSRSVALKEVFAFYEAFAKGEELVLPEPRPYGEYIAWLDKQDAGAAESYWKSSLAGVTAPTSLTIDRKSVDLASQGREFSDERTQLSQRSSETLKDFARENKLTLNTLAQAAWALLLNRYSGDENVVFGVTIAGRPATLDGVESMVGLFVNTLPLSVFVSSQTRVLSWLKELQERQGNLQQYEYSSLIDVQGWSDVPRGVPLFESIFVFENLPVDSTQQTRDGGIEFVSDRGLGSTTGYPLTVLVTPGTKLTIQFVYDRARFDRSAIQRLLGHYQKLLESLPLNSTQPLWSVPILPDEEREQILVEWNNTQGEVFKARSIKDLFESFVEKTPDITALVFGDQELTYRELNARANQLAHGLQKLGVGPEVKVGISIERSIDMIVGVLATLKAGAAYVALDADYPSERLQFMIADAHCQLLLSDQKTASTFPETNVPVLCLDSDWHKVAHESTDNLNTELDGENLVYVIYTSGSTGLPKGISMRHRSLLNLISWQLAKENSFAPARTLQFAALNFDISFQEMFSTWCAGETLVLASTENRRDPVSLLRLLAEQKVERLFLPFVLLQHLAEAQEQSGILPEQLREIFTAGEQLEVNPRISNFFSRLKQCMLYNQYGPSECHVVTIYKLPTAISDWPVLPPVGKPILNTQIYLLNRNLEPVPIGVPGEVCIGGASVARGYLNKLELTAEKFLPDPFSKDRGARMYRTGDLARFAEDGNIEFLGRIDNQVKIRGFRVELGEIETMLLAHESVREAVVVAREAARGDRRLVAYVVSETAESNALRQELRTFLKKRMPEYMVPSDFVLLDAIPLTSNGKINHRALPQVDSSADEFSSSYEAPRSEVEEKMAELWCGVLKRGRVGIHDNFFELGGHSLLATQLVSRLRETFRVELPLRRLFESPTVAELSAIVVQLEGVRQEVPDIIKTTRNTEELLAKIDELSDEEVEALLSRELAEKSSSE